MKKLALILPLLGLLAACDTTQGTQAMGTVAGAALGSAMAPEGSRTEGALIGATAGLIAGSVVAAQGQCNWTNPDGTTYLAPCPQ
jgi:outer membrane lipoprotein SlyB